MEGGKGEGGFWGKKIINLIFHPRAQKLQR
jgi:hypothetical protein